MHKKFVIKFIVIFILAFGLLIAGCDFAIRNFNFVISTSNDNANVWINSWFNKKTEIAKNKSLQGRKIIFIAGSSMLFGVNTKKIEEKYKIPTVNFGTNAAYQNIIFKKAQEYINKEDLVIVPLEYRCYKKAYQEKLTRQEIEYIFMFDKNIYKNLIYTKKISCICFMLNNIIGLRSTKIIEKIRKHVSTDKDTSYSIKNWNENGDNVYLRKHNGEKVAKNAKSTLNIQGTKYYTDEDIKFIASKDSYLNSFVKYAKEKGAKVYFIAPPFISNPEINNFEFYNIKELWEYVGYNYLDNIHESFYDKEYFYDTINHLTTEGAELRTKQIIDLFDKYNIVGQL